MDYVTLTEEEQKGVLMGRLRQFEAEHLNHKTNIELVEASGTDDPKAKEALEFSRQALVQLDEAHAQILAKLETMGETVTPATPASVAKKRR